MSSNRRVQSSRANGSLSRGPLTPETRQQSARNSLRHGMLSETVVLEGESKPRFLALLQALTAEFQPVTEAETALVESMTVARWRQMRTWGIGKFDFDREMARQDPAIGAAPLRAAMAFRYLSDNSRSLDLVNRYETTYERQFSRAIKDLLHLQKNRSEGEPAAVTEPPSSGPTATWDPPNEISETNQSHNRTCVPATSRFPSLPSPRGSPLKI